MSPGQCLFARISWSLFSFRRKYFLEGKRMKTRFLNVNESISKSRVIFALLVVLALILCTSLAARAQNITASIRGTVTDEQGTAIPVADVTIANSDTAYPRSDMTDKYGA